MFVIRSDSLFHMSLLLAGTQANVLQEAHVPIISDAVCNGPDYYDNQVTTTMFCAGYEKGGTDSCQVQYLPVDDIISLDQWFSVLVLGTHRQWCL